MTASAIFKASVLKHFLFHVIRENSAFEKYLDCTAHVKIHIFIDLELESTHNNSL